MWGPGNQGKKVFPGEESDPTDQTLLLGSFVFTSGRE